MLVQYVRCADKNFTNLKFKLSITYIIQKNLFKSPSLM